MALVYTTRDVSGKVGLKMAGKKNKSMFLSTAGFTIKLSFEPTDVRVFEEKLTQDLERFWGKRGFLKKSAPKWDFEISFSGLPKEFGFLEKGKDKKHFFLMSKRNISRKKARMPYWVSLKALDLLLREVFSFLLKGSGFVLHGASCADNKGLLRVFLAPSGGGKTTAVNLASSLGFKKYGDDTLIVKKEKGKWTFYSPPFIEKDFLCKKQMFSKAKFYFVKKAKRPFKKKLTNLSSLLKLVLSQIWLNTQKIDKETFKKATEFVDENDFYELGVVLDRKKMKEVL